MLNRIQNTIFKIVKINIIAKILSRIIYAGIYAFYIVARLLQEQGNSGSSVTSGNGYNGQYVGYYNAFNIAASGSSSSEIITNALAYAKKKGWTSLDKSINEGISFLANQYIKKGQSTLYLQKFDVEATDGLYSHQYMQNILAAQNEGTTLRNTYINKNAMSSSHTFIIPVYENMPSNACSRPNTNGTSTTDIDLVKVNVEQTLRIRNAPNGGTTVGWLYKNEIVTRLEKATSKVGGTYWDKVQKSDGTIGYAARETYDSEASYKLYLVPVNESNTNTTTTNVVSADNNNTVSSGDIDQNGKVDAMDMYKVIQYILGNIQFNESQKNASDLNNDGTIDAMDMYLMMQKIKNS